MPKTQMVHPSSQHHGIKDGVKPPSMEQKMIPRGVVSNRGWWEKGQLPHYFLPGPGWLFANKSPVGNI